MSQHPLPIPLMQYLKVLVTSADLPGEIFGTGQRRRRWALNRIKARYGHTKYQPHQGAKECARRVRQAETAKARDAERARRWGQLARDLEAQLPVIVFGRQP